MRIAAHRNPTLLQPGSSASEMRRRRRLDGVVPHPPPPPAQNLGATVQRPPPLPQPKSAVADFGHFVERPNPRYSEVRLGRGRGWGWRNWSKTVPHSTTPLPGPPPAETACTRVSATQQSDR